MAVIRATIGSSGGYIDGVWTARAMYFDYDYDTVADKALALYYKNAINIDCWLTLRDATTGEIVFQEQLPANAPTERSRSLSPANRPTMSGISPSLTFGAQPTAPTKK